MCPKSKVHGANMGPTWVGQRTLLSGCISVSKIKLFLLRIAISSPMPGHLNDTYCRWPVWPIMNQYHTYFTKTTIYNFLRNNVLFFIFVNDRRWLQWTFPESKFDGTLFCGGHIDGKLSLVWMMDWRRWHTDDSFCHADTYMCHKSRPRWVAIFLLRRNVQSS